MEKYEAWEDALGVFSYLCKPFDCVDHNIVIRKLHHYGIKNKAFSLLISCFNGIIHMVHIIGIRPDAAVATMDVTQYYILD